MGYSKNTIYGVKWIGGFRIFSRIVAFGRIALIARLLTPNDFGLYGIAALVLAFLEIFTSVGINVFLIQKKRKLEDYIDTAWVISIFRGFLIGAIIFITASFVAQFFESPESVSLLRTISIVAIIRGFISPSRVQFQKSLAFNKEVLFGSVIMIADTTAVILVALFFRTPFSLVAGLIAGAVAETMISHLIIKPKPKFIFSKEKAKEILHVGKWVTITRISGYFYSEGDDWVVGKLLNSGMLGIYQAAYKISTLPITEIRSVVNKVVFPIYANIYKDKNRVLKAHIKSTVLVAALSIPMGLVIYRFPDLLVKIMLGEQWLAAIGVVKILALFGVVEAIVGMYNPLFMATGNQKYVSFITILHTIAMFALIVPFINLYGVEGAAYAVVIGSVVPIPLILYLTRKIIK